MTPKLHCYRSLLTAAALCAAGFAPQAIAQNASPKYKADVPKSITTPNTVQTERLGTLKFFDGMPDAATVQKTYDNLDFMRGVDTFLTGIPTGSIYAMLRGMESNGVEANKGFGITEELLDARSLWLTPNTTTMYILGNFDLTNGPVVLEASPELVALVDDASFHWVTDIGFTGRDKGKGGKYLLGVCVTARSRR